jgi:hypothetical protein
MLYNPKQWLETKTPFGRQKPGQALVKWLNQPEIIPKLKISPRFIENLLADAQFVFGWRAKYGSLRDLNVASKKKKLPLEFWASHQRLNEMLATFTCAPQIYLEEPPDGDPLIWSVVAEESPVALLSIQVRWVLQLIAQRAIHKVRKCQQCSAWFFARRLDQQFCKASCRRKHFETTEEFKATRRQYMRKWYKLQKSANVK